MVNKAVLLGLTEDDCYLTTRFIFNEVAFVQGAVSSLGLLPFDGDGVYQDFLRVRAKVQRLFFHSTKTSYIFPEEEFLMYSIVSICKPKKAVFLGVYYGYWAIWAALADEGLHIILIDIDPVVCSLAEENIRNFGLSERVEVVCDDAASYMSEKKIEHDFLVIDAECPYTDDIPSSDKGKGIYNRLFTASHPFLKNGGYVICHNILTKCDTGVDYLKRRLPKNANELSPFLSEVGRLKFELYEFQTTEGVGIYKKTGEVV